MRRSIFTYLLAIVIAVALAVPADGQRRSKRDVKRERQKTEQQISRTKKQIAQNDRETGRQLDRLNLLNATIALRADTIAVMQRRIDSIDAQIAHLNDSITFLTKRNNTLKANYAKTLRTMRSRRQGMSDLAFIFSANSFSQAWRRMRYLEEIAKSSTRQARQINAMTAALTSAKASLDSLRTTQAVALQKVNDSQIAMKAERASADILVGQLRKQGKSLNRELERRNRQAEALDRELDRIIEQEIREAQERERREAEARAAAEKARKEAEAKAAERAAAEKAQAEAAAQQKAAAEKAAKDKKKKEEKKKDEKKKSSKKSKKDKKDKAQQAPTPAPKPTPKPAPKPAPAPDRSKTDYVSEAEKDRRLTGSFEQNKGRLLFPVPGRYTITSGFGTYEHPDLAKVKLNNLGIDIEVPEGSQARAIFDGVVSSIFRLDGYHNVIIVRHGSYLSVYAGVESLGVKKGDKVKAGQNLGRIFSDSDDGNRTKLHFEIRREKQKLNPVDWVK